VPTSEAFRVIFVLWNTAGHDTALFIRLDQVVPEIILLSLGPQKNMVLVEGRAASDMSSSVMHQARFKRHI